MIVRIPSLTEDPILRQDYQELFKMVETLVGQPIESLSDYYRVLNDPDLGAKLRAEENGQYLRINLSEPMITVNLNTRSMTVPPEFKSTGAIIRGDHLAEILFFKTARYFDEMDLAACEIEIECIAVDKQKYRFPIYAKQIIEDGVSTLDYEDDRAVANEGFLIFGWVISKEVTALNGDATFAVRFYQQRKDTQEVVFNISTTPDTIKILPSFALQNGQLDHQEFGLCDYRTELSNRTVYSNIINSMGLKPIIVNYSWEGIPFINFDDGKEYATVYLEARDLDSNVMPLEFRWVDEKGVDVSPELITTPTEENNLWKSTCKLNKAGTYFAMVGNYVDDKGNITDPETGLIDYDRIAWVSSQPIYIPVAAPVTLDLAGTPLKGYTTSNEFNTGLTPVTSLHVNAEVAENPNGEFVYSWYRNNEKLDNNSNTLAIAEELIHGDYYVTAHYSINGTNSAEVSTKDTTIILRPAPVMPDPANFVIQENEQDKVYVCVPSVEGVDIDDLYYYWSVYDQSSSNTIVVQSWSRNNTVGLNDIEKYLGDKAFGPGDVLSCSMKQVRFADDPQMMRESYSKQVSYTKTN